MKSTVFQSLALVANTVNPRSKLVVTIDGPAASGKGTISYLIARRYGLANIDSGACYRAVAWLAMQHHIKLDQQSVDQLVKLLDQYPLSFTSNSQAMGPKSIIKVGQIDITDQIRNSDIDHNASLAGTLLPIRKLLQDYQRQLIQQTPRGAVLEGRDTGSVVYPEADLKFFLTSSVEVRAQRRHAEYVEAGQDISFEQIYSEIAERDRRDTERAYSALRIAEGAIVIDSSNNTIDMTVDQISAYIDEYLSQKSSA